MADIQITKQAEEFLVAEFNALQSRAIHLDSIRSSRINFFIIATAAVGAGISSVIATPSFQIYALPALIVVSIVVWLLGFLTLKQSLEDSIAIVILLRRAGRIRFWFVKNNPAIKHHVAFEYSDDRPVMDVKHLVFRGGEAVLLVINLVAFSAFTIMLLSPDSWLKLIAELIVTSVFMWFIQVQYSHRKLRDADNTVKGVNFRFKDVIKMVDKEEKKKIASQSKKEMTRKK